MFRVFECDVFDSICFIDDLCVEMKVKSFKIVVEILDLDEGEYFEDGCCNS